MNNDFQEKEVTKMFVVPLGWLGYFLLAWILAGMNLVFVKKGLEGMSPAMAVAMEALVLFLIRLFVYGPARFLAIFLKLSPEGWVRLLVFALILAGAWIVFFYSMQITSGIGVAPFAMLLFVVNYVIGAVTTRILPSWQMIVILLLLTVGIFLMGFGREHKHSWWWVGAIGGPLLMGLFYYLGKVWPLPLKESSGELMLLFFVIIISIITSVFMKNGDVKKITVYHLIFIILAALCVYFAPVFYGMALGKSAFDLFIMIAYALWIIISVPGYRMMANEILSNVGGAGLVMIIIATIGRIILKL